MTFTDEDLKRLKELIPKENPMPNEVNNLWYKLGPLLARLEAAEELAQEAMCHCKYDCDECGKMKTAWQKAKGVSK
jgi:hypothetical protein